MDRNNQQGFSLIELMVVVAIVSILSSLAIPAYKTYMIRAKATEMLSLAQTAKLAVSEALVNGEAKGSITNASLGLPDTRLSFIESITVAAGVIRIAANNTAMGLPENAAFTIALNPTVSAETNIITWECQTAEVHYQYTPQECHHPLAVAQ